MSLRSSPPRDDSIGPAEVAKSTVISSRISRITPRNSDGDDITAVAVGETPYGTLRQLANIPKPSTPLRRASSAGPQSHRSSRRTPTIQIRTPGALQRAGGSVKRVNATTPHGRAAVRDFEARRAGLTPGKDRRRSGRQRRETPRDDLRALSRLMASKSQPVVPTPTGYTVPPGKYTLPTLDDLDDGPDPIRPRLSLPLDEEDDEDDSLLLPPRSAGLEDENFTAQSIELPRRALSEQAPGRLSRGSFGSVRMSDQFGDLNERGFGGIFDSSFAMGGPLDNESNLDIDDQEDNDASLRGIDFERGRISLASGRGSDIGLGSMPADDTENTFVFTVPPRDGTEVEQEDSVNLHHSILTEENEHNDFEEMDSPDAEEPEIFTDVNKTFSILDTTVGDLTSSLPVSKTIKRKKKVKISKHGIQYPSLPAGVVKKLAVQYARASGNGKSKISKDTLDAIMQASDWFFEQVSEDLGAYSQHAGRKTIDESDIITLMKRQRQTNATTTPFSLAQRYLPRELLQELRMAPPSKLRRGKQLQQVDEAEEE